MKGEPKPVIDQRLIRAMVHPRRIEILEALVGEEDGLGTSVISKKLEIPSAVVSYHVKVLATAGAVEAVPVDTPAAEPTFRLTPLSLIGNRSWRELSSAVQDGISTALLQSFMSKAANILPDES